MFRISAVCVVVVLLVLVVGCRSNYLSQPASPLKVTTEAKLTPNISVGEKIQATATVHKLFGLFSWGPGTFAEGVNYGTTVIETPISSSIFGNTVTEAKAAAAYKACTNNKADFIVCPRYYIITRNYFLYRKTKARVFGYKGVLESIEKTVPQTKTVQSLELTAPIRIAEPIQIAQPVKVVLPKAEPAPKTVQLVRLADPVQIAEPIQIAQPVKVVLPPKTQPVPVITQPVSVLPELDRSAK